MLRLKILFLVTTLVFVSGYRWRCYIACTDQTSTQNDYTEQRDKCREYAQLKVDMSMRETGNHDEKSRKSNLVSLFSQCMGNNGWIVPDGRGEGVKKVDAGAPPPAAVTPQAATAAPPAAAAAAANKTEERAHLMRASECAFARYHASVSGNAAARAQACDLECEHALRAAPGAPHPASCPPDHAPHLARSNEKK
jgi:hypothetical protein